MATVIDALTITLGLDASQFRKDQVAVADGSKKLKESLVKDGKDVEKAGKDAAESWGSLKKEILGVISAYVGLDAIKNAVGDVTKFNKELSQSAQSIGVSTRELSAWGMAVERMGGDANSARASLQHLADVFNDLKSGHASPAIFEWFGRLQAEGGVKLNAAKPMLEQLPQIAEGLKHIAATQGASRALFVGKQLGLDEGTIRLLMQGKDAVKAIVENMEKLAPTAEQIDKTNQLYQAWVSLRQTFDSATNILVSRLSPALTWLVDKTRDLIEEWRSGNVFEKWDNLSGGTVKKIYDEWMELGRKIKEMWLAIPKALGQTKDLITDAFKDAWKDAFEWLKGKFDWLKSAWNWVRGNFGVGGAGGDGGGTLTEGRGIHARGVASGGRSIRRGGGGGHWWTPEREQHAIDYLTSHGVSELGAKALVSRWKNVESAGGPGATNPNSGAFGISQWLGRRKNGINGDTDFDHQLAHVAKELHTTESGALDILNAAKTADEAARGASAYERAEGWNPRTNTDNYTGRTAAGINGVGGKSQASTPPPKPPPKFTKGDGWTRLDNGIREDKPKTPPNLGAKGAAGARNSINNSSTTNSSNSETHINGGIAIHTQATDAPGLMREMQAHIDRQNYTAQANYGIA